MAEIKWNRVFSNPVLRCMPLSFGATGERFFLPMVGLERFLGWGGEVERNGAFRWMGRTDVFYNGVGNDQNDILLDDFSDRLAGKRDCV